MGFVYFVQCRIAKTLEIKIGSTHECPFKRLKALRKRYRRFDSMEMLGSIQTKRPREDERALQKQFAQYRRFSKRDRDWFQPGEELRDYIEGYASIHFCHPDCHRRSAGDVLIAEKIEAYRDRLESETRRRLTKYKSELMSQAKRNCGTSSATRRRE